jgi:uncharacterized protein
MEIKRKKELKKIEKLFKDNPVVCLLGPRQCGKTTLAGQFAQYMTQKTTQNMNKKVHFFDCEDPRDNAKLDNPMLVLESLQGVVIIDEIQMKSELFSVIRVLADQKEKRKFLILGSASRELVMQDSESLAGRVAFMELSGFCFYDIQIDKWRDLWLKGGFPRSFLAKTDSSSLKWRQDFIRTFLERDIPNLGINIPPAMIRRFWTMLSHYHGQVFNASEMGRSLQLADTTVKRYLDILTQTLLIRKLQPWFYNTKKRLVKTPKIYFRDSGILHTFMTLENMSDLENHPKIGASWEGFAMEQVMINFGLSDDETFFWALHTGGEMDLVFRKKGRIWGIEVKYNEAPKTTKSMRSAISELGVSHIWVIYPGDDVYPLDKKITAVGITRISDAYIKSKKGLVL